jgi:hypothetical protein
MSHNWFVNEDEEVAFCTVCRGWATVDATTDCPGRLMTTAEFDAVKADRLDYVDGKWVDPSVMSTEAGVELEREAREAVHESRHPSLY